MDYRTLLSGIPHKVWQEGTEEVGPLGINSLKIKQGDTFIALVGVKRDGHEFIPSAVEKGAKTVICNDDRAKDLCLPKDVTLISLPDTRDAFSALANNYYGNPSTKLKLIGVTGTNGKTSTTTMAEHILRSLGHTTCLIGTIHIKINNEIVDIERTNPTTPDCIELGQILSLCAERGVEYVLMEASSMAMKMKRVQACNFDTAVFTNLSPEHLDDHGTMEDYQKSKMLLFPLAKKCVVNLDDERGEDFANIKKSDTICYGIDRYRDCDLYASDIEYTADCVNFTVHYDGKALGASVKTPSRFAIYNALAAMGICLCQGMAPEDVVRCVSQEIYIAGRYEVLTGKDVTVIVDFAHTPVALENLLKSVRMNQSFKRIISVFGCGGDRDPSKRAPMGKISQTLADYTVVTSDNPRTEDPNGIVSMILSGMDQSAANYTAEVDREKAIEKAIEMAKSGDVVVISGKGHETKQLFGSYEIDFDDKVIAGKYLAKRDQKE